MLGLFAEFRKRDEQYLDQKFIILNFYFFKSFFFFFHLFSFIFFSVSLLIFSHLMLKITGMHRCYLSVQHEDLRKQ